MFKIGTEIYIQFPGDAGERVLHPGRITRTANGVFTAELIENCPVAAAGTDIGVFCEVDRKFMQQPGRIDAVLQMNPRPVIAFQLAGAAVSAENRECFRVSTVVAGITALVADEKCTLIDVSATGLAVMTVQEHYVGVVLPVVISFEGADYVGEARVQSMRHLAGRRWRCGLYCMDHRQTAGSLARGLERISADVQRRQLRRMAAAG